MKVRALVSFSGIVSMAVDEVADIPDDFVAADLIRARYVEKIGEEEKHEGKNAQTGNGKKRKQRQP